MLSKKDLDIIEKRIEEINRICDLCDPIQDQDILFNLDREVDMIIARLESAQERKISRGHLRLIK